MVGELFAVDEVDTIHGLGAKMVAIAGVISAIDVLPGFATCATAMPSSAIAGVCAGKGDLLVDLLSRAAGRVEQIGNACTDTGNGLIDTEEESASGFRALGDF